MDCKNVKEKLPEYLAGVLDDVSKNEIKIHLKDCEDCKNETEGLNEGLPGLNDMKQSDINRVLKKTKRKFKTSVAMITSVVLIIALIIYMIPVFLWGVWSFNQGNATRMLFDIMQFSQPNKVNSWGNHEVSRMSLSVPISITVRPQIGKKYGEQREYTGKMSVITGKVCAPNFLGADFIHPELFKGTDLGKDRNIEVQSNILKKNADTTVAIVDFSFNKTFDLKDLMGRFSGIDAEICWMAVESGIEGITYSNMTFENQQVRQWGIPGKLSNLESFDYADLNKINVEEYEKSVINEFEWLLKNKNMLKCDDPNLKYVNKLKSRIDGKEQISGSMEDAIQYILKYGFKVYGIRVTGPSSELLKLTGKLDLRTMKVVDMDFWNW